MLIFGSKIISGKRGNRKVKRYTMAYWPPIARLPTWCVRGRKLSENRLENGPYLAVALHLLPLRRNALYSIAPETDNNGSLPRSQTEKKHHRLHFSWFDYEIHVFPFWYLQHKKKEKKKLTPLLPTMGSGLCSVIPSNFAPVRKSSSFHVSFA